MEPIRIYVAAPWVDKEKALVAKKQLEAAGYVVTSRWIEFHENKTDLDYDQTVLEREALHDVEDVALADLLVLLNTQPRGQESTGKAVETGLAMAMSKGIIIVGEPTNIFHVLYPKVASVDEAIALIKKYEAEEVESVPATKG